MHKRLALVVVVAAEVAALVVAWRHIPVPDPIDWHDPAGWLRGTDPEHAVLALGRVVVLGLAAGLLGTTALAIVARCCLAAIRLPNRARRLAEHATRCAPALVRHLVEGAIAVSLVSGASGWRVAGAATGAAPYTPAPATARPLVAPLAPVRDGFAVAADPAPGPAPAALVAAPAPAPPVPPAPPGGRRLVVVGESLWTIARDHLAAQGLPDDDATVARYWRDLCEANRDRLPSRDVDLVRPGDDLDLPPVA